MTSLLGLEQQQQQKSFLLFLSSLREYPPTLPRRGIIVQHKKWYISYLCGMSPLRIDVRKIKSNYLLELPDYLLFFITWLIRDLINLLRDREITHPWTRWRQNPAKKESQPAKHREQHIFVVHAAEVSSNQGFREL